MVFVLLFDSCINSFGDKPHDDSTIFISKVDWLYDRFVFDTPDGICPIFQNARNALNIIVKLLFYIRAVTKTKTQTTSVIQYYNFLWLTSGFGRWEIALLCKPNLTVAVDDDDNDDTRHLRAVNAFVTSSYRKQIKLLSKGNCDRICIKLSLHAVVRVTLKVGGWW